MNRYSLTVLCSSFDPIHTNYEWPHQIVEAAEKKVSNDTIVIIRPNFNEETPEGNVFFREWRSYYGKEFREIRWWGALGDKEKSSASTIAHSLSTIALLLTLNEAKKKTSFSTQEIAQLRAAFEMVRDWKNNFGKPEDKLKIRLIVLARNMCIGKLGVTFLGLKEAKDLVEWFHYQLLPPNSIPECFKQFLPKELDDGSDCQCEACQPPKTCVVCDAVLTMKDNEQHRCMTCGSAMTFDCVPTCVQE